MLVCLRIILLRQNHSLWKQTFSSGCTETSCKGQFAHNFPPFSADSFGLQGRRKAAWFHAVSLRCLDMWRSQCSLQPWLNDRSSFLPRSHGHVSPLLGRMVHFGWIIPWNTLTRSSSPTHADLLSCTTAFIWNCWRALSCGIGSAALLCEFRRKKVDHSAAHWLPGICSVALRMANTVNRRLPRLNGSSETSNKWSASTWKRPKSFCTFWNVL